MNIKNLSISEIKKEMFIYGQRENIIVVDFACHFCEDEIDKMDNEIDKIKYIYRYISSFDLSYFGNLCVKSNELEYFHQILRSSKSYFHTQKCDRSYMDELNTCEYMCYTLGKSSRLHPWDFRDAIEIKNTRGAKKASILILKVFFNWVKYLIGYYIELFENKNIESHNQKFQS